MGPSTLSKRAPQFPEACTTDKAPRTTPSATLGRVQFSTLLLAIMTVVPSNEAKNISCIMAVHSKGFGYLGDAEYPSEGRGNCTTSCYTMTLIYASVGEGAVGEGAVGSREHSCSCRRKDGTIDKCVKGETWCWEPIFNSTLSPINPTSMCTPDQNGGCYPYYRDINVQFPRCPPPHCCSVGRTLGNFMVGASGLGLALAALFYV